MKKSQSQKTKSSDSIYMQCPAQAILRDRKQTGGWLPRAGGRWGMGGDYLTGSGFPSEVMKMLSYCVVVMVAQLCE